MSNPKNGYSMAEVLAELRRGQLLTEEGEKPIADWLEKMRSLPSTPWYFQVLAGLGAWVAAAFFIAFLGAADLIDFRTTGALIAWGLFFIAGATVIDTVSANIFLNQTALAFSTAGHVLVLYAAGDMGKIPGVLVASILLGAVLYPLYKSPVHRFFSCLLAIFSLAAFILDSKYHHGLHALVLAEILGLGIILYTRQWYTRTWKPAFYALAVSLPLLFLLVLFPRDAIRTVWWPSSIILGLALVQLYRWVTRDTEDRRWKLQTLAISIFFTLLLAVVSTPGLLAAAGLLVLGYHLRDNPLTGLGLTFFPVFIVVFYYNLSMTLDVKSLILAGSGLLLLGLRWYLGGREYNLGDSRRDAETQRTQRKKNKKVNEGK